MIGPRDKAGKNVNPPTIRMTAINKPMNNQLSVRKVPAEGGVIFFFAMLPAIASTGRITPKRPINMPNPNVML